MALIWRLIGAHISCFNLNFQQVEDIARETGQPYEKIVADTDRNFWMSAEEAKANGLVSKVVSRADEV